AAGCPVHQLQRKAYPVARICRVLRISRSGFYEAHQRRQNPRPACPAAAMIKATFESTEQCYGSRRLVSVLRNEGVSIGRLNAQLRKIIKTRGHFPNDEAATKLIWLGLRNITVNWSRAAHDWKGAMNQFAILYGDRFTKPPGDYSARQVTGVNRPHTKNLTVPCSASP
ncbi:transposase, partial [Pseudomonas amygdali]